jgi:hypothetical protein
MYGIQRTEEDDWFDCVPIADTPLFIDPFLVFQDSDSHWAGAEQEFVSFFAYVIDRWGRDGFERQRVLRLLNFYEPKEFALGVAVGHPAGSGTGPLLAGRMASAIDEANRRGLRSLRRPELLTLLCDGIGPDRISDLFCDILKRRFISYTQHVAKRHGIKCKPCEVPNFDWRAGSWVSRTIDLPRNPATRSAILLTPERFLQEIRPFKSDEVFDWALMNHGTQLRDAVSSFIAKRLAEHEPIRKKDRAEGGLEFVRKYPELGLDFVDAKWSNPVPYNLKEDPKLVVRWLEVGRNAALRGNQVSAPTNTEDVARFVTELVASLKHAVEREGLWKAFRDVYGSERPAQIWRAICASYLAMLCERADVTISRPFDIGREPVQIRTRTGLSRPIEIVIQSVSRGFRQRSTSLPKSSRLTFIPVGLVFEGEDYNRSREDKFVSAQAQMSKHAGTALPLVIIDAQQRSWA